MQFFCKKLLAKKQILHLFPPFGSMLKCNKKCSKKADKCKNSGRVKSGELCYRIFKGFKLTPPSFIQIACVPTVKTDFIQKSL